MLNYTQQGMINTKFRILLASRGGGYRIGKKHTETDAKVMVTPSFLVWDIILWVFVLHFIFQKY